MFLFDPFHPGSPPLPLPLSPLLKELVSAVRPAWAARALAAAAVSALIASSVYQRRGYVASCVLSGSPGAFCCMPFPHHHHYAEEFPESASAGWDEDAAGGESCSNAARTDKGQSWNELWILCHVTGFVAQGTVWFMGIVIGILGPWFRTYVRGNAVYPHVWMGAGERSHRGVWERAVCLMLSERLSRVCIVVLEEVEEDEPSPSPPPPQTRSSPERRAHPVCRKAATHQDKVRRASQLASSPLRLSLSPGLVGWGGCITVQMFFSCLGDAIDWLRFKFVSDCRTM